MWVQFSLEFLALCSFRHFHNSILMFPAHMQESGSSMKEDQDNI